MQPWMGGEIHLASVLTVMNLKKFFCRQKNARNFALPAQTALVYAAVYYSIGESPNDTHISPGEMKVQPVRAYI
jgi:hypothetical protein